MLKTIFALMITLVVTGCASSIQKIPSDAGITEFTLENVEVMLALGSGAIEGDTTFATQDELQQQFVGSLQKHLKEKGLLAVEKTDNTAELNITINYLRRFNWGGKALNKPEVSHTVSVQKDGTQILSFGETGYTTKYSYLKDIAVNVEIASFKWDKEDEPLDIDMISSLIVEDIVKRLD